MGGTEKPLCFTFLVCDQVITEAVTNKKILVGTFNRIVAPTFPYIHASLTVFVSLTNGRGELPCALKLTGSDPENPVFELQVQLTFPKPTDVIEASFNLRILPFEEPGIYNFQFLVNQEIIATRPIIASTPEENLS